MSIMVCHNVVPILEKSVIPLAPTSFLTVCQVNMKLVVNKDGKKNITYLASGRTKKYNVIWGKNYRYSI